MSTYSYFTQFNLLDEILTPPMYRQPNFLSWLNSLSAPLQTLQNEIYSNGYVNGSVAPTYSATQSYFPNDQVIYLNRQVWQNLATCSGIAPTITATNSWYLYNNDYIGAEERVRYNSQVLWFEYALNRFFQTGVTPISNPPGFSGGILIVGLTSSLNKNTFLMGNTSQYSSTMRNSGQLQQDAYLGNYPFSTALNFNGFTILVPIGYANTYLGNTQSVPLISSASNTIIRAFADDYVLAGQQYNVATY